MAEHRIHKSSRRDFLLDLEEELREKVDLTYLEHPCLDGATLEDLESAASDSWSLLKPTGVVAVAASDSTIAMVRSCLDGFYGAENFIAQIIFEARDVEDDSAFISVNHEFIVLYAKHKETLASSGIDWRQPNPLALDMMREGRRIKRIARSDRTQMQSLWDAYRESADLPARFSKWNGLDAHGIYSLSSPYGASTGHFYTLSDPDTGESLSAPDKGWEIDEVHAKRLARTKVLKIVRGAGGAPRIMRKTYLTESSYKDVPVRSVQQVPTLDSAELETKVVGSTAPFGPARNMESLRFIVETVCPEHSTIVDPFGSSGMLTHMVMDLNDRLPVKKQHTVFSCVETDAEAEFARLRLEAVKSGLWHDWTIRKGRKDDIDFKDSEPVKDEDD